MIARATLAAALATALLGVGSGATAGAAETPVHGAADGLSFNLQGEIRVADDRVRGRTDPEWFSFDRVGGFIRAQLHRRVALTAQGAWDHGTGDFTLECAELAAGVRRSLEAHAGIFLVPLGRTNLDHDAPRNEFDEYSLPATQLIGVPNAQLGAGVRGRTRDGKRTPLSYEMDLVTGYDDGLVMDSPGGTRVPRGRNNYGDNNGIPALVGRVALHPSVATEIGLAAETGQYNKTKVRGVRVDSPRYAHVVVADATVRESGFNLSAEAALALVDVPPGLSTLYAEKQWGASLEGSRTLLEPVFRGWENSALTAALRADAVDLDRAVPGDSRHRLSASLNFRHRPFAVLRLGWYYEIARDRFNNDTPKAGVTFTAASYF